MVLYDTGNHILNGLDPQGAVPQIFIVRHGPSFTAIAAARVFLALIRRAVLVPDFGQATAPASMKHCEKNARSESGRKTRLSRVATLMACSRMGDSCTPAVRSAVPALSRRIGSRAGMATHAQQWAPASMARFWILSSMRVDGLSPAVFMVPAVCCRAA